MRRPIFPLWGRKPGDFQPLITTAASLPELKPVPPREPWEDWLFGALYSTKTSWGDAEIREADPEIEVFENALYVDLRHGTRWGLFDADGSPIEAAIDRQRGGETLNQLPELPERAKLPDLEFLNEELMYVGRFNPHFGHFLVEVLPRYWMLSKEENRGKRLLIHTTAHVGFFPHHPFARDIFGALGLSQESFVAPSKPVRVPSVTVPTASYRSQAYGHPAFRRLCLGIGERLLSGQDLRTNDRPVWFSKSALKDGVGRFANENLVEQALQRAGVEIVHPELLPFSEQVRLLATRSVVMGTTGSAFHSLIFTPPPKRVILIDQTDVKNSNFELIDRLRGAKSEHYYPVGAGDVPAGNFHNQRAFPEPERVAKAILDLL